VGVERRLEEEQVMDAETEKPTVKTFQDDIGVLNALNRLSSKGVPKESLHLFAHDEQRTDCLVGEGVGTDVGDLDDLVADRYNESGDELRQIFRRFGFGDEEADDLETKLQDGTILLLIDRCGEAAQIVEAIGGLRKGLLAVATLWDRGPEVAQQ
jgi:molybdopterin converting factor small subunit